MTNRLNQNDQQAANPDDALPDIVPPAEGGAAMVDPRDITDVQPVLPEPLTKPAIRKSERKSDIYDRQP